jgi:hypothetical protein
LILNLAAMDYAGVVLVWDFSTRARSASLTRRTIISATDLSSRCAAASTEYRIEGIGIMCQTGPDHLRLRGIGQALVDMTGSGVDRAE